jgi:truncated hemoglobin YjbI
MSADLAQIDQDRALILAGVSHDLRTPLTRLRMGIEMSADEGLREGMTADIEEMDKTIGQFLDFARSEGGEAPQAVDLAALLADLASQYRRRSFAVDVSAAVAPIPLSRPLSQREKGGELLPSPSGRGNEGEEPTFGADLALRPQALRRAVSNLIDNALRYAGSDNPVELKLGAGAGEVAIEVCDHGPGIPPQDVERIKRPFARLDAARSNAAGAGLGLAIVERIARSHNGRLELLPREGGGLVARLVLRPIESRAHCRTMNDAATTPFVRIGGEPAVRRLVTRFYELMDTLPEAYGIRKLHQPDLSSAEEKLFMFLCGWLGGPQLYVEKYGHPRLRARHLPFAIASAEAEQWMLCMRMAMAEVISDEDLRARLDKALDDLALHMRNRSDPPAA